MHSTQAECTAKDENGNTGTWFDDPSTTVNVNADDTTSTIDTTLPPSNAYVTPVAQLARNKLLSALTNANPCWAFFNAATSKSGMGSPGQTFANTDVRLNPGDVLVGGWSAQGSGSQGPIFINPNSAFSNSSVPVNGQNIAISIGPFKGATMGAQEGILAHEFGHKTNAIPSDATSKNNPGRTQTRSCTIVRISFEEGKMKFWLVLVLLIGVMFCGSVSVAQSVTSETSGLLVGAVTDAAEKAPIKYAFVLIHQHSGSTDQKASLDSNGRFTLHLAPGLYDIFVAADGFAPKCEKVKVLAGKTRTFDVALSPDTEHLESKLELPH